MITRCPGSLPARLAVYLFTYGCISPWGTLSGTTITAPSPFSFREWPVLISRPGILCCPFLVAVNPAHAFCKQTPIELPSWSVPSLLAKTWLTHFKQTNHKKMNV